MFERHLVPVYLPSWAYRSLVALKRFFIPGTRPAHAINISGERNVEWSFLSREMPNGPGEAFEFGCEQGYMSLLAAQKGFHVIANDLQEQTFIWQHSNVQFLRGDFLKLELPRNHFELAINCSSVEHVGVAGRYGIEVDLNNGDIEVMGRLADILKSEGRLLMTAPVGTDAVMAPWCRVYGVKRLPLLFERFAIEKEEYWVKNERNQWILSTRENAFSFPVRHDPSDPHGCAYALGCFILRKLRTS
jgi:SAM-dependent methyltransferase